MKKTAVKLTLCLILLAVNILFIWGNSFLPAQTSDKISGAVMEGYETVLMNPWFERISVWVINFANRILGTQIPNQNIGMHLLRKMAHFTEFLCLGLELCWLFLILGNRGIHSLTMPMLPGVLVACMDETIQLYSPGRSSSLVDVWIDIAGLTAGILILLFGYALFALCTKKPTNSMEETT